MRHNLSLRTPPYNNPVVGVIMNYSERPEPLFAIVREDYKSEFSTEDKFILALDDIKEIIFFGYKEQCERNANFKHRGKILQIVKPLRGM